MKSNNNKEILSDLSVCIGKDELGNNLVINIPKLSHLLIGGVASSGKSNLLHRIIAIISACTSPDNLKLILIDPKKIELNVYNNLPHLLTPVITDVKRAVLAMKWAGKEMERRLGILQSKNVKNIESYRMKHSKKEETMPYIMVVIDGLSDLMDMYPVEVEMAVARLVQMSHLVGIHIILSTSRVTNKVITEPIKSGIQSRIAFKVSSSSDSMSIIGADGAERLNAVGEILFQSASMKYPIGARLSPISEAEITEKLKTIKKTYKEEVRGILTNPTDYEDADDMYESAREAVIGAKMASTSFIQRKLGIGYSRAAQLMDMLEERGVIGATSGSKPRKVLG